MSRRFVFLPRRSQAGRLRAALLCVSSAFLGVAAITAPAAAQTISSAANQTFVVGGVSTAMSAVTITDAATPTITALNDIRIRIPVGLNMTWDPAVTTATIAGGAAGNVSTTVSYANGNRDLVLNVTSDFLGSDQIVVSGLRFTSFSATSPATGLALVTGGAGGAVVATDNLTKTIVAPTLSSAANQTFVVGAVSTTMNALTITDATTASITAANDIRIRIPAGLNMTWDPTVTTATIAGGAAGKVSTTVSYANGNRDLVLNVTSDFLGSDQIVVSGLKFTSFTAVSPATGLVLITGGAAGTVAATDIRTKTIVAPTLSSAANQTFVVGAASTAMSALTITDATTASITAVNDIRIRIPAGLNMTWDPTVTTATITGGAAGKVSTAVSYANGNLDLVLNVTADFLGSDQIVVSALKFTSFSATSPSTSLVLVTAGAGGAVAATDIRTKTIVAPTLSSVANQTFVVGVASTAMSALTITDATTASITAANDIRVRIPAGLNMTWDPTVTTATIAGGAAGKVSTTVSYANGNKDLVLDVTSDFLGSDQIVVSGLNFTSFSAPSPATNLVLVTGGAAGTVVATDNRTKAVVAPSLSSAANQTFVVGVASTAMSALTITDATTASVTAANDIRIRLPAALNMTWDPTVTTATITGTASAKVSTTVSFANGNRDLVLNVTADFLGSDQIVVSGLRFTSFSAPSPATNLVLVTGGAGGLVAATDDKTKTIVAPSLSSAANQTFVVGGVSTAMSALTIIDATTASITAANDIRIRVPAGLNMTWDPTVTTATITGGAAGKVSTTVSYANGNKDLVVNVTTDFLGSDQIVVSGLRFTSFSAVSPAMSLVLVTGGAGGVVAATDDKTKTIVTPSLSSAVNQTLVVGAVSTPMSALTITDATTSSITAVNDIRIRIPAGLNMTWDPTITTATITGGAAGKVSTTVSYANGNKDLVLNVTSDFLASDQIVVSGLRFTSFTATSPATSLVLVTAGAAGTVAATDDKTKTIVAPSLSSSVNQTLVVGAVSTTMSALTITDATTASVTAANDIRIRIPAALNMTWDPTITTATVTGGAAGKVSTTVSYANGNRDLVLDVTSDFLASDQIVVSGLNFTSFTATSPATGLVLVTAGAAGTVAATDIRTKTIVAPSLSSTSANQTFVVGGVSTAMTTLNITDATTASITAANDIRIRIPAGLNMTWDPTITTATIAGGAAGKVSTTVSYANGNRDMVVNVTTDFLAGDQIAVSGLRFTSFSATSPATGLVLITGGAGGAVAATDNKTKTIVAPSLSSAANQTFVVGAASTAMSALTITDATTASITAVNDIRIRIPAALNMTWDPTVTTATITGGAAGKVSTAVSYANGNLDLVLNVTTNFTGGNQIVVSGLKFTSFTAPSPATSLVLVTAGAGGTVAATDIRTKTIIAPTLSSAANQTFVVGAASTTMSALTVTDGSTPTVTAVNDIRIRIPAGLNMTWDPTVTTATITGTGSAKVSTTVSYANGNRDLVLDVTTNFAGGDQIVVSGLKFTSFTATSPATSLEFITGGAGGAVVGTDDKTKTIVTPTLSSAANQTFVVGAVSTTMSALTITDGLAPAITAVNDIRIRIPAGLNMTWDPTVTTATITGTGSAKVSTTVSYANGNRDLVLNVTSDFLGSDQIAVSGLRFTSFTATSPAASLALITAGAAGAVAATDPMTKTIVAPTLSSAANQIFVVGAASTTMSAITVTDGSTPTITATSNIRIRIPAAFNMTWNTALATATIGGGGAAKVSTAVTYEDAGKTLVVPVTSDFVAGEQIIVSGLQFTSFTAPSPAATLELVVSGAGGSTAATDDKTKIVLAPGLTESASQVFGVGDPATAMTTATVTDASTPTITATNDIRIRIPAGFNMTWNTALTTATIGGVAAPKVSTTVSYEDAGRTLVLNVTSNFAANDQVTVAGLQFNNFLAPSAATALEVVVAGAGGAAAGTSNQTKQIVAATIASAANQIFAVVDPPTAMSPITVTDATTATITAANDIRIRIPAGFNMTWNTALTTATIGGGAAAKVSTSVSYEDAGRTLVLNVTSNFAAGNQITISGLQFANFTAPSAAARLELAVAGTGAATVATDTRTKLVVGGTISSAADQTFVVGQAPTAMSAITVTDGSVATITAANDIRIRLPAGLNMTWNTLLATATIGGSAAAKVSTTVSYEDAGRTLVLNVTSNFAANDQIIISGLQFDNFTAVSAATSLELIVGGASGGVVDSDNRTKQIEEPTISSAANQTFVTGQAATAMSTITVTDASTATITAANDIRIRIPAGFNMTWNTALTTATIGGGAAAKLSPTVSYADAGKTLVLNVTSDFAATDQITVTGLQFTSFSAVSAASSLQLVVTGSAGGTSATDDKTIAIATAGVTITPNAATTNKLPSNGVTYTVTRAVKNTGSQTGSYDLLASRRPGGAVTLVSITGPGVSQGANPDSARLTNLAPGVAASVTLTYSVGNVAAGTIDTLFVLARSITLASATDSAKLAVIVSGPRLSFSKAVSPSGTPPPGTDLTYTATVTNIGTQPAYSVILVDSLPGAVEFKVGTVVTNMPGGISVTVEYSNDGGASWTYTPVSGGCAAPAGYDACVNRIHWLFLSSLSSVAPNNTGNVQFVARIP